MELFTSKTDPGITQVIHLKDEESELIPLSLLLQVPYGSDPHLTEST